MANVVNWVIASILISAAVSVANVIDIRRDLGMARPAKIALACFPAALTVGIIGMYIASLAQALSVYAAILLLLSVAACTGAVTGLIAVFTETNLKLVRLVAVNVALWIPAGLGVLCLWCYFLAVRASR